MYHKLPVTITMFENNTKSAWVPFGEEIGELILTLGRNVRR